MATELLRQRLQTWIWVLVYGGMLTGVLGLFVLRQAARGLGLGMVIVGAAAAVMGFALIFVRARMNPPPARP